MKNSRVEKNKKIYSDLEEEMKNNKGKEYEKKLVDIDPIFDDSNDNNVSVDKLKESKKGENKGNNVLTAIAREINSKKEKREEIVVVKEEKKNDKKEKLENKDDYYTNPISFTDKLSVEEILRAKIEQQQKIKDDKKKCKKSPTDDLYTPSMMQERIKQHEGVDIRKEAKIKTKNFKWVAVTLLIVALLAVIIVGGLLIFRIIEF